MRYFYHTLPHILISTFFVLFFNMPFAEASVIVRPPNNLGLVGYWSLDEGRGTQASDLSGNGNDGVLVNSPGWVSGRFGGGLQLNGSTQHVQIPDSTDFDIGAAGFTYAAWIKPTSFSQSYNMFMGHYLPYFNVRSNRTLHLSMSAGGSQRSVYGSTLLNADQWYHAVATYDADGYMRVFLNGVQDGIAGPYLTAGNSSSSMYIGKWQGGTSYPFTGHVDEVRVYNRALSEAEVLSLYANTKKTVVGESASDYYSNGLVAHWTFDGAHTTGAALEDKAGSSDGTISGAIPTLGRIGQGLAFDGTDDGVSINWQESVTDTFTMAVWVYPERVITIDPEKNTGITASGTGHAKSLVISEAHGGSTAAGAGLSVGTNGVAVIEHASSYYPQVLSYAVTLSGWTHIAIVYENRTPSLYINGQFIKTGLTSGRGIVWPGVGPSHTGGSNGIGFGNYGRHLGKIDDVRIYNRALSADEVQGLANGSVATIDSSGLFLLFDDFNDGVLDGSRWQTFGTSYGTISESNGEVTITNSTGSSTNLIGIASQVRFAVGTTVKVRAKNTQGKHSALVAIGESPFHLAPHATGANFGASLYSRADAVTATISLRRENTTTLTGTPSIQDYRNYQIVELRRVTADLIEFYVDDVKVGQFTTAGLTNDYFVYFSADGHTKPNTMVIDQVEVTE